MENFRSRLNRNPYAPIDGASVTRVDELGNGYDDFGQLVAPKFQAPEQTWGETALGVATAPARMTMGLVESLSPYGADGWQIPPIVSEGVDALTAVGDAYTGQMAPEDINSRALGMAGFMMGGGGLAARPAGGTGMFAGRLAKTADQEALARAERLAAEGADRNAIWNETGWFQGPDQKWRFEIDADGFRKSALHEMQHDLQRREGFAYGGTATEGGGIGYLGQSRPDLEADYKRLAGETEARNVQTRMNMSADQRRATPPWETQDIPFEDQIVRLYSNASKEGALPALMSIEDQIAAVRQPARINMIDRQISPERFDYNFEYGGKPYTAYGKINGKSAEVDYIGGSRENLPNTLGPSNIRQLMQMLREDYPEVSQVSGSRASGARNPYASDELDYRQTLDLYSNADSRPALLAGAIGGEQPEDILRLLGYR